MKILLLSHGGIAKKMIESFEMICGKNHNLYYEALKDGEGIFEFRKRLASLFENEQDANWVVLTDIKGGSPYTACIEILAENSMLGKTKVISGMNLPLLIALVFSTEESDDKKISTALFEAKEAIEVFKLLEDDDCEL